MKFIIPIALIGMAAIAHGAQSAPARVSGGTLTSDGISNQRTAADGVTLDLYQNGFGFVRDRRQLPAGKGQTTLSLNGLPNGLDESSLRAEAGDAASVLEMAWRPAPAGPSALLARWVGSRVILAPRSGHGGSERSATLIAVSGDTPVVRTDDGVELGGEQAPWRLVLPAGDGDRTRPRLAVTLDSGSGGDIPLTLSYLTNGLSWQADYRLEVDGDRASLSGYASLHNDTDVTYSHVRVTLVAGNVRRDGGNGSAPHAFEMQRASKAAVAPPEQAGAWHAYPVQSPTGLPAGEVRRIPLLSRDDLPVQRRFRAEGVGTRPAPSAPGDEPRSEPVAVRFEVDTGGKGAAPLPGGTVRVTESAAQGGPRFLGSNRIEHTPAGEPFTVDTGTAFDVTASRRQTDYRQLDDRRFEIAWEITLHNAGDRPAPVDVIETMGGDWSLTGDESNQWERRDAHTLARQVSLAAGERRTIAYRVRVTR